ncbi:DUF1257 domain-containing protein [Tautonia marina]|uniref:DUF1257 domain-containing protein n=1 Tax=Tautonia marina TaxID=2653855 RepID=UPI00126096E2|nr:DUF1257 domain-containing protein [Tautonia marina]
MSHIVTIKTEVRDAEAVKGACKRLDLDDPVHDTVRLFSGEATGLLVHLPGWTYPVVIDTANGQINFDNYEGRWGSQEQLDAFIQAYAIERAKIEARKRGHRVHEQPLPDGSVKLTIQVVGGVS